MLQQFVIDRILTVTKIKAILQAVILLQTGKVEIGCKIDTYYINFTG
jgi:hypothetical protein